MTDSTINRDLNDLRRVFNLAEEINIEREEAGNKEPPIKLPKRNPARKFKKGEEFARARYLLPEEFPRLFMELVSESKNGKRKPPKSLHSLPQLLSFVLVALNTGLRRGNIQRLCVEDVDFNLNVIKLKSTKGSKLSKSRSSIVLSVPMNRITRAVLWKEFQRSRAPFGYNPRSLFEKVCKWAGLQDFEFRDLRRTFCTIMLSRGVDHLMLKRLMGHASFGSFDITARYAHVIPKAAHEAVEKVADYIEEVLTPQDENIGLDLRKRIFDDILPQICHIGVYSAMSS